MNEKERDMKNEEYEKRLNELAVEMENALNESFKIEDVNEALDFYRNHPSVTEYNKLWREYKLKIDYDLGDIPTAVGDKLTLDDFAECCHNGGFVDYDGTGYYATEDKMSDIPIAPSDITSGVYRKDFTHVIWFNK